MHYGIPQTGTKISIIKRIIDHRVEQETEYVQPNNLVELFRYFIRKPIFGIPGNQRIIGAISVNDINNCIGKT